LDGFGNSGLDEDGSLSLDLPVALSDFGKEVTFEAPKDFEPLEKVFEGLFSGIG
jgi:hypothetical protein